MKINPIQCSYRVNFSSNNDPRKDDCFDYDYDFQAEKCIEEDRKNAQKADSFEPTYIPKISESGRERKDENKYIPKMSDNNECHTYCNM